RHGDKTVFFGRFIAVLRAWAAFLAGVNRMKWGSFLVYNAAGGILWAIIYGCLGFFAGRAFHNNFSAVESLASTISWVGAILIAAAVIVAYIAFRIRRKHRAQERATVNEQKATAEISKPGAVSTAQPEATESRAEADNEPLE